MKFYNKILPELEQFSIDCQKNQQAQAKYHFQPTTKGWNS